MTKKSKTHDLSRLPMTSLYVLANNMARTGYHAEHGLCFAISLENDHLWLWDTGQKTSLLSNSSHLNLDLSQIKGIALSHGHYDHTGGLYHLISTAQYNGPVFGHEACLTTRYAVSETSRAIGIPENVKDLIHKTFCPVSHAQALDDGLVYLTDIPRKQNNYESTTGFFADKKAQKPDHIPDDAFLILTTNQGPAIILGCCHSGLENSLEHAATFLQTDHVYAVIGGLHLTHPDLDQAQAYCTILNRYNVQKLHLGHCTGAWSYPIFQTSFQGEMSVLHAGDTLIFP